ncbi:MAG: cytochrome c1 [Proteobacteria bacterium]|nr:cytochrome c1 [Pseudomonadota bacterium]
MVRGIAFVIGVGFTLVLAIAFYGSIAGLFADTSPKIWTGAPESAETDFHLHPRAANLRSDGVMGKFDKQQLQRGFQVYKEVCAACHSLRFVAFRDLEGIGYNEAQVKAIAAGYDTIPSVNPDTGEPATRKGTPADRFPMPFANDIAARAANNNAVPPDLSYITRARHGGADYVYSLITGYRNQPAELLAKFPDIKTPKGLYYNPYFANLNIAMPPPLKSEGQVQYADGTRPTVDNMARDVSAFLVWAGDPNLEKRHQYGFFAVIFLLISAGLAYGAYRNVWRDVKH